MQPGWIWPTVSRVMLPRRAELPKHPVSHSLTEQTRRKLRTWTYLSHTINEQNGIELSRAHASPTLWPLPTPFELNGTLYTVLSHTLSLSLPVFFYWICTVGTGVPSSTLHVTSDQSGCQAWLILPTTPSNHIGNRIPHASHNTSINNKQVQSDEINKYTLPNVS